MSDSNVVFYFFLASMAASIALMAFLYLRLCKGYPLAIQGLSEDGIAKRVGFNPRPFLNELHRRPSLYFRHCCGSGFAKARRCPRARHGYVGTYKGLIKLYLQVHRELSLFLFIPACLLTLIARHL